VTVPSGCAARHAAAARAERSPLVEERLGDGFAQRQLCRGAEAGEQIVVNRNRLFVAAERSERARLVEKRIGDLFAQR